MRKLTQHLRYFFLIVGAGLLILLIRKIGVATIIDNVRSLGWFFLPILSIKGFSYIFQTSAWMQFIKGLKKRIGFFDLFRIKVSGEAINTLTPANFIGGDPMRIYLLKRSFPVSEGAASVVVDRTLQSLATLVIILLGIAMAFLNYEEELSANITYGVPIAFIISFAFMGFILVHQRRGLFGLLLNVCRRLGIKREFSDRTVKRIMELDGHIIDFYNESHRGFLTALACHIAARLIGVLEIYVIGRVVSDDFTLFAALMLAALAPLVIALFAFIPGAFGVMEGAFSGVLYLLHLDPSIGITIQIAKRLSSAFWIALGLLFLGAHDRRKVFDEKGMIEQVEEIGAS